VYKIEGHFSKKLIGEWRVSIIRCLLSLRHHQIEAGKEEEICLVSLKSYNSNGVLKIVMLYFSLIFQ